MKGSADGPVQNVPGARSSAARWVVGKRPSASYLAQSADPR